LAFFCSDRALGSRAILVGIVRELAAGSRLAEDPIGARGPWDSLVDRPSEAVTDAVALDVGSHIRDVLLARTSPDESLARELLLHRCPPDRLIGSDPRRIKAEREALS
jgi:hypothetical protein